MEKVKLTPKMKKVIKDLNGNYYLITSNQMTNVFVWEKGTHNHYVIQGAMFWRMVNLGIIHQRGSQHHHDFALTHQYKTP
jgi:hypothetical protein